MAKLILKSPYIKGSSRGGVSGYLKYIATRERVEILADQRPATRRQEQMVKRLLQDFPDSRDLLEYEDYTANHTKSAASSFITIALEQNWQAACATETYMKYIATRPRVERLGEHGLFGDRNNVDLGKALGELDTYTGNVWTHIISLRREDANRLGYNRARVWQDLLKAHRNDIASAMNIPIQNFRWYAAFHDEGKHPHVHLMAWSQQPGQGRLNREGIAQIKSVLVNDIFQGEMLHIFEQKDISYKELTQAARESMRELVRTMEHGICDDPQLEEMVEQLALRLQAQQGKKLYSYLPKALKAQVDQLVEHLAAKPEVAACYEEWNKLRDEIESYYKDTPRSRQPLSRQKEFRAVKNMVVREALRWAEGGLSFEDGDLSGRDEPEDGGNKHYLYAQLRDIILDEELLLSERDAAVERLRELAQNNYPYAQHLLGKLYRDGGLLIHDSEQARYWFGEAAAHDLSVSQYALGKLLLTNDPAVHDTDAGLHWLAAAANQGNHYAAYRLGKEYLSGSNTPKDVPTALHYFRQAAEQGNQYAQYALGKLYLQGREIPADQEQAEYWLTQAAAQGNAYAQIFLQRMAQQRPPTLVLAATHILRDVARIFRDNSLPPANPAGPRIDSKRRQQLMEKRMATGQRLDDTMQSLT